MAELLTILVVLVILGVVEWLLVESGWVPLAAPLKVAIRVVFILLIVIWLLNQFGLWGGPILRR